MQTFLPYADFQQSAKCLDNKRLGKQRVECLQILNTLSIGPYQKKLPKQSKFELDSWVGCSYSEFVSLPKTEVRKTPWYNHPAVRMWKGHEWSLYVYAYEVIQIWRKLGFSDTCMDKLVKIGNDLVLKPDLDKKYPKWLGNPEFHASHRSNLLRKDPMHYGQFGWTEPNNLPYIWPV